MISIAKSFARYIGARHHFTIEPKLICSRNVAQLTSEGFVTTNARQEELLALDSQHKDLCNVDTSSTGFTAILRFLTAVLEDTRLRIVRGSPECKIATVWFDSSDEPQIKLRLRLTTGRLTKVTST